MLVAYNPALYVREVKGIGSSAMNDRRILSDVIACFDDTGLDTVRWLVSVPALGIGEAAYHAASMIAAKFSVVTTLSRSVPGLENNLQRYGLSQRCSKVRATDIPVLKLEEGDPTTLDKIRTKIRSAFDQDYAEAIVLGVPVWRF